jgi:hypothetical protein
VKPPEMLPPVLSKICWALFESWCRESGISEEKVLACARGDEPWPPLLERVLRETWRPLLGDEDFVPVTASLTKQHGDNTLPPVNATSLNVIRSRARMVARSDAAKLIAEKGLTFVEMSKALTKKLRRPVHVNNVQAWCKAKDDPSYRKIPEDAADACLKLWGIRVTVWPSIILNK